MSQGDTMHALALVWQGLRDFPLEILLPMLGAGVVIGICSGLYYRRKRGAT